MKKNYFVSRELLIVALFFFLSETPIGAADWYHLTDTNQTTCYDMDGNEINCPDPGFPLYGQDAQFYGPQPAFMNNGDGTVTDQNTGLNWQYSNADINNDFLLTLENDALSYQAAVDYCNSLSFANYDDWRLPDIFELESIVDYANNRREYDDFYGGDPPECWSATTASFDTNSAWSIGYTGISMDMPKSNQLAVRCVRENL